jgi:hypothetical protein
LKKGLNIYINRNRGIKMALINSRVSIFAIIIFSICSFVFSYPPPLNYELFNKDKTDSKMIWFDYIGSNIWEFEVGKINEISCLEYCASNTLKGKLISMIHEYKEEISAESIKFPGKFDLPYTESSSLALVYFLNEFKDRKNTFLNGEYYGICERYFIDKVKNYDENIDYDLYGIIRCVTIVYKPFRKVGWSLTYDNFYLADIQTNKIIFKDIRIPLRINIYSRGKDVTDFVTILKEKNIEVQLRELMEFGDSGIKYLKDWHRKVVGSKDE